MYELIIIGAGPAGMTAAVYAARKKLNALLVSKDLGGQPNATAGVENYMGYQYIDGPELMQKFEQQVRQFPIEMQIGDGVIKVSRSEDGLRVETEGGETYFARAAIFATGKRPRQLNVPGEAELRGKGVTYCAICDGPLFQGEKVAVVGGGNSALEAAADMLRLAEYISLVSLTPLTADAILIDRVKNAPNLAIFTEHEVQEIEGDKFVESITVKSLRTGESKRLTVKGVFVEIGMVPNSESVKGLVKVNPSGEVVVNAACETGVPGLFAAGDVTDVPEKQIVVAAGEGAKAALRAHRYLQRLS